MIVGAAAALYGAMGLGQAIQNTMHVAWSVPRNSRPNPFYQRFKSLLLLLTAGMAVLAVSVVSAVGSNTQVFSEEVDIGLRWLINLVTVLVVGSVLALLLRTAAAGHLSFFRAAPGAFAVAVMWQVLQYLGTLYVARVLVGANDMNQTFGLVLGLIGIIYLGSVMAVLGIEINVVLAERLYPRALLAPFTDDLELTDADRRAYAGYARAQRHKGFEIVEVKFADHDRTATRTATRTTPSRLRPCPTTRPPRDAFPLPGAGRTRHRRNRRQALALPVLGGSGGLRGGGAGRRGSCAQEALGCRPPLLGVRHRTGVRTAALVGRRRAVGHRRGADARGAAGA